MPVWKFWLLIGLVGVVLIPAAFVAGVALRPMIDHRPAPPPTISVQVIKLPTSGIVSIAGIADDGTIYRTTGMLKTPTLVKVDEAGREIRTKCRQSLAEGWIGLIHDGKPYRAHVDELLQHDSILLEISNPMELLLQHGREKPLQALKRAWDEEHPK